MNSLFTSINKQVKDVRLPQSLQRAMAAEAEAAREARAKVMMLVMMMVVMILILIFFFVMFFSFPFHDKRSGDCGGRRAEVVKGFERGFRHHLNITSCTSA